MKRNNLKQLVLVSLLILLISCGENKRVKQSYTFPFHEWEMKASVDVGLLLEYAIYDNTKIDFVKNLICDTLNSSNDFIFNKCHTTINDSSYYFYYMQKRMHVDSDYVGVLFLNSENLDSISLYNNECKFSINDFEDIVIKICNQRECTIKDLLQREKVGNHFIPDIFFIVEFDSMKCEDDFIERVIQVDNLINSLMTKFVMKEFPNDPFLIAPYIELRMKI